jgi:hypothetical protein
MLPARYTGIIGVGTDLNCKDDEVWIRVTAGRGQESEQARHCPYCKPFIRSCDFYQYQPHSGASRASISATPTLLVSYEAIHSGLCVPTNLSAAFREVEESLQMKDSLSLVGKKKIVRVISLYGGGR